MAAIRFFLSHQSSNILLPFFAREQLIDYSHGEISQTSFSFGPQFSETEIGNLNQRSKTMKIENILHLESKQYSENRLSIKHLVNLDIVDGAVTTVTHCDSSSESVENFSLISSKDKRLNLKSSNSIVKGRHKSKRHQCGTCLKTFSRPSSLKAHSYVHTGEKPYECSTPKCGMKFNVFSNLKRHNKKCGSS